MRQYADCAKIGAVRTGTVLMTLRKSLLFVVSLIYPLLLDNQGPNLMKKLLFAAWVALLGAGHLHAATLAHWRFEEGPAGSNPLDVAGSVLDSSGNGNHGQAVTGAPFQSTYSADVPGNSVTPGDLTNSLSLSFPQNANRDQAIVVPDSPTLNPTDAITVEMFIKPTTVGPNTALLFKFDSRQTAQYALRYTQTGNFRWVLQGGLAGLEQVAVNSTEVVPLNEWSHVAGTWSSVDNKMRLYINYVDVTPDDPLINTLFPGPINTSSTSLSIGAWKKALTEAGSANNNSGFPGFIDEVRISDVALTPDQFLGAVAGPVESADFDESGDVDGLDFLIWQQNVGTLTGANLAMGDANGDGAVNDLDLTVWKGSFGAPATAAIARVPEPPSLILATVTPLLLRWRSGGNRRSN